MLWTNFCLLGTFTKVNQFFCLLLSILPITGEETVGCTDYNQIMKHDQDPLGFATAKPGVCQDHNFYAFWGLGSPAEASAWLPAPPGGQRRSISKSPFRPQEQHGSPDCVTASPLPATHLPQAPIPIWEPLSLRK